MNLQPFQDTQYDDEDGLDDFRLALQLNHDKIYAKMAALGLPYQTYPLIDNSGHNKDWQQNLQTELQSIYSRLNITGIPDLSGSDLSKQEEFEDFMQLLVQIETGLNKRLGIY